MSAIRMPSVTAIVTGLIITLIAMWLINRVLQLGAIVK